jgi:hypothetical protein
MNKKKIAICFWGLARNLSRTIDSIKKVINLLLNKYDIDIYFHTYAIYREYNNIRANEMNININNNEYKLLDFNSDKNKNIKSFLFQEDMDKIDINLELYKSKEDPYNNNYETIKNLIYGMYSLKKVTKMMLINQLKINYDYVIYMRPDVNFERTIPLDLFQLINDNTVIIPKFHSWYYKNFKHYQGEGTNDRFIICNPITSIIYGLRYDYMLEYSKINPLHSETYLKYILDKSHIKIIKDARICFNRVRINNIKLNDCNVPASIK